MANYLVPRTENGVVHSPSPRWNTSKSTRRSLEALEQRSIVRMASLQAEGLIQTEKLHEIDRLAHEAMTGQAMLAKWRETLAQGDPFIADELRFFSDVARVGKGEIIADTISTYCQESRS